MVLAASRRKTSAKDVRQLASGGRAKRAKFVRKKREFRTQLSGGINPSEANVEQIPETRAISTTKKSALVKERQILSANEVKEFANVRRRHRKVQDQIIENLFDFTGARGIEIDEEVDLIFNPAWMRKSDESVDAAAQKLKLARKKMFAHIPPPNSVTADVKIKFRDPKSNAAIKAANKKKSEKGA